MTVLPCAPPAPHRPAPARTVTLRAITDSAEWAWWISDQSCLQRIGAGTLARYGPRLHTAAVALLVPHLVLEWAYRGYVVTLVPAAVHAPPPGQDTCRTQVADAAAAAIDPLALLDAAGVSADGDAS